MRRVLFLTSGDPALPQLAGALLRHASVGQFAVYGAATDLASGSALLARLLDEVGIAETPPPVARLAEYAGQVFDEAIVVCPGAAT